jgi:hypothetical protein
MPTDAPLSKVANRLIGGTPPLGLWVGGTVTVTATTVEFHPNAANRAIHPDSDVVIPLGDVSAVRDRFGVLTRILDIDAIGFTLTVRCFGTKALAERILAARG